MRFSSSVIGYTTVDLTRVRGHCMQLTGVGELLAQVEGRRQNKMAVDHSTVTLPTTKSGGEVYMQTFAPQSYRGFSHVRQFIV